MSAYAADRANTPSWSVNIKTVEWKTPPPPRVGPQEAFVAHFLGRRMAYTYEIVELVPGNTLVMGTAEGPFPMETTYAWKDAPKRGHDNDGKRGRLPVSPAGSDRS